MSRNLFILRGIILISFLIIGGCNYTETMTASDPLFTLPPDSGTIYSFTKNYFILVPGDTALFYGARSCTVSVNGVITSVINDSSYLRTITQTGTVMTINDTPHYVYPRLYQQSSAFKNINDTTITRCFEKTDSAIMQVAYSENGIMCYPEPNKRLVMPRTLIMGPYGWLETDSTKAPINNTWPSSPLIRPPVASSNGAVRLDCYSVAAKAIALPKTNEGPYVINGNSYRDGLFIKTYCTISGETVENNTIVRILGTIMITRTYFRSRGMIDQRMITSIQKAYADGSTEIIRERTYVARGPEGAPEYPDTHE